MNTTRLRFASAALVLLCAAPLHAQPAEQPVVPQPGEPVPAPAAPEATPQPATAPPSTPETAAPPAAAPPAPAPPPTSGPTIELPPEAATEASEPNEQTAVHFGVDASDERVMTRGLQPVRLEQQGTVIGGYGQFNLDSLKVGEAKDFKTQANLRRIVLFVSHHLTDDIAVYTEFEWENALACDGCAGSAEVEQAFVDWKLLGDKLALRAGLVLVPMGIINQWHEPPVFHGVERPMVDEFIIPTTWRELGAGITGHLGEIYHYELYLTTTVDPTRLGPEGLSPALTEGSLAPAESGAVTGRFEAEPVLGVIAGAAFFLSDAGGNGDFFTVSGRKRNLFLPILGYALDARARRFGFEARAVWAQFFMPNSGDLMSARREDGSPLFPNADMTGPVATRIQGGYIELAYDVLHEFHTTQELLPFIRLETYDTQAGVPKGYKANPRLDVNELTTGLTYRPIRQLVFKSDLQLRDRRLGWDELQVDVGMGYMF
jgi:hypothetical protein